MPDKTGIRLKRELGLENFPFAKIMRLALSSYKILMVAYNSYRPTMPITSFQLRRWPFTAMVFHGTDLYHGSNKVPIMTPPMDLEDYNGALRGALIVPVDLAGHRFIDDDEFTKVFENKNSTQRQKEPKRYSFFYEGKLNEFVTLQDLADTGNISDFTMKWRKDRNRVMGSENTQAKLIDCVIDEAEGSATFQFLTEATELGNKQPSDSIDSPYRFYPGPKGEVDPSNFSIDRNTSKTYELQIKVLDILEWLKAFDGEKIGRKEMKEILDVSNVQVFSTSPSFHWQGANYNLSQLDGSMYPTDIPNDTWGPRHGDKSGYFLDKHLYGLLRSIEFFLNPMASMLTSKLQQRGLI